MQKQVHRVLEKIEDEDKRLKAVSHLHGVALAAAVLAKKRGEDAELATMAGLLHDLYAYKSGSYDDHARLGAEYARKLLEKRFEESFRRLIDSAVNPKESPERNGQGAHNEGYSFQEGL